MRITGGSLKGRKIHIPSVGGSRAAPAIRPTSDKVREALFQILTNRIPTPWESLMVLDLFAGSGALGIEAISRGAGEVIFVDMDKKALDILSKNLEALQISSRAKIYCSSIHRQSKSLINILKKNRFDLILADPPYSKGLGEMVLELVSGTSALRKGGWMVLEEFQKTKLPLEIRTPKGKPLKLYDKRDYGQTSLWFYTLVKKHERKNCCLSGDI